MAIKQFTHTFKYSGDKVKLVFKRDINIIFGHPMSGKSEVLKAIKKKCNKPVEFFSFSGLHTITPLDFPNFKEDELKIIEESVNSVIAISGLRFHPIFAGFYFTFCGGKILYDDISETILKISLLISKIYYYKEKDYTLLIDDLGMVEEPYSSKLIEKIREINPNVQIIAAVRNITPLISHYRNYIKLDVPKINNSVLL